MRFSNAAAAALLSSAALLGNAVADELDEKLGDAAESSTVSASTSTKEIVKPSFTALKPSPSESGKPFFEQFTPDWNERWKVSHAKKENTEEEWAYVGQWDVEETTVLQAIKGDKYLVAKNKAAHHAISAKFDKPIDNTDKTLVVQYEVKLQDGLDCGGAYMKLLKENKELHADEFSNASPYVIMFGPDKCGSTNKVHFIFKHKNPKTGEYEEKHLKSPPAARMTRKTVLYTLIVKPDSYFEIRMDGERVKNGTLLEDFTPSVIPDKEIDDKDDTKPSDWVDQAMIPDSEAAKPEDWDENAPYQIVDEDAVKPEDWLENEPETIPDPEAEKPEGWEDDEDGDWIAPQIPNPKCEDASGCGPWKRPMKDNPAYKGKWTAPMISNPDYKGVWAPRKIPNPDFFEDSQPSKFEPIGAIGFELWTMNSGISFDNIYIGHSIKDAENIQHKTFDIKHKIESEEEDSTAEKPDPYTKKDKETPKSPMDISFKEDPVNYVKENLDLFITLVKRDPVEAVKFMPEFAAGLGAVALTLLGLLVGILSALTGGSSAPAPVKKPIVVSKKTEIVEPPVVEVIEEDVRIGTEDVTVGTTTGAENIKATKRGTTSRKE